MSEPTKSPSTKTALKLSRTRASGWWIGTIVGWTRTLMSPLSASRSMMPSSLTTYPRRWATAMSAPVISLIPSWYTSPATTLAPKATEAMIAALAPASKPSTSAVGSRSAYPSRCASASAVTSRPRPAGPSVIFVRMKFVVPLMMPSTRVIGSPCRLSRSARTIGMPPATAASNNRSTPGGIGGGVELGTDVREQFLVGRHHRLAVGQRSRGSVRGRARCRRSPRRRDRCRGRRPAVASRVSTPSASSTSRWRGQVAHRDPGDLESQPGPPRRPRSAARRAGRTAAPTLPQPSKPIRIVVRWPAPSTPAADSSRQRRLGDALSRTDVPAIHTVDQSVHPQRAGGARRSLIAVTTVLDARTHRGDEHVVVGSTTCGRRTRGASCQCRVLRR